MVEPDLQGFRDAMVNMRIVMGEDVTFFAPQAATYPAGTPIDPETGKPFDPTIGALSSGWSSGSARAGVYTQPIGAMEDDAVANAVGWFEEGHIVLDVDPVDAARNVIENATEVEVRDERYEISDRDKSGVGGIIHRVLMFIKRK